MNRETRYAVVGLGCCLIAGLTMLLPFTPEDADDALLVVAAGVVATVIGYVRST
ncbi:hypothetical protein [Halomicrobium salinisoli]|uniref:hypothetical protein n=1 Tax=Halomicrobium salinisoli TaxID=2878391 RepID=UPI001CEFE656|nr:hypothetical protein [Halomicrobium salinisoli]